VKALGISSGFSGIKRRRCGNYWNFLLDTNR
jgi:hypothetical protein